MEASFLDFLFLAPIIFMGFSVYVVMYNVQTVSLNFPTPALVNGKLVVIVYQYLTKKNYCCPLKFFEHKGSYKSVSNVRGASLDRPQW